MEKQELREQIKKKFRYLSDAELKRKSDLICFNLGQLMRLLNVTRICTYIPYFREEPNISDFLRKTRKLYRICVPVETNNGVSLVEPPSRLSGVHPSQLSSLRPFKGFKPTECALLVPGLAFDVSFARLGRGKGWYDQFLKNFKKEKPVFIGVAYSDQIVDKIKEDAWDVRMDIIVTDTEILFDKFKVTLL
ncbi:MAG: 5-formyltetrahydrofolate cyclo-ligase [Deltaproteobacteria bacterium]|nr:5-formyltetrahydrofolate cyclo-ligase [Deltaproteobacteria bacterium]